MSFWILKQSRVLIFLFQSGTLCFSCFCNCYWRYLLFHLSIDESLPYHIALSYIWEPIRSILVGIVSYIPNLFTFFVIYMAIIRYLVRLVRYLAGEVQSERLKLRGFYPDWAIPTYHIIRFLLYAFYDSYDLSLSSGI